MHFPEREATQSKQVIDDVKGNKFHTLDLRMKILEEALEVERGRDNYNSLSIIEEKIHDFTLAQKAYIMNLGKRKHSLKVLER